MNKKFEVTDNMLNSALSLLVDFRAITYKDFDNVKLDLRTARSYTEFVRIRNRYRDKVFD